MRHTRFTGDWGFDASKSVVCSQRSDHPLLLVRRSVWARFNRMAKKAGRMTLCETVTVNG